MYHLNLRPDFLKTLILVCSLVGFLSGGAVAQQPVRKKAVAGPVVRKSVARKTVSAKSKRRRVAAAPPAPVTFVPQPVDSELMACTNQPTGPCPNCVEHALATAHSLIGLRYRRGGSDPKVGFDCSGLVQYVFASSCLLHLPRSATDQFAVGQEVAREDLQRGDLVFFRSNQGWHVGIYSGDDHFIHSPNRNDSIRVSTLETPYWKRFYKGARRLSAAIQPPPVIEDPPSSEERP